MIASQYVDYDDKKICAYLLNLRHLRAITYLFISFIILHLFPTANLLSGISFVTTEPALIILAMELQSVWHRVTRCISLWNTV